MSPQDAVVNYRANFPLGFGVILLFAAFVAPAQTAYERDCARLAAANARDAERLHQLFKLDWEHTMRDNPEYATAVGYPGQNDRWGDSSLEAIARRQRELRAPLAVLKTIRRAKLGVADQL